MSSQLLTPRWKVLKHHHEQQRYLLSPHRFNVVPAGRRSGKTEIAKRKLIERAMCHDRDWSGRFFAAAPTRDQAKRIYWEDLKALTPKWMIKRNGISESELTIKLVNDCWITVIGMDKPERIEGSPWDGGVLDEYGNMKKTAWALNVEPALADREGWCDFIGVPEGRNHYYDIAKDAENDMVRLGDASDWGYFHWISADILPKKIIDQARRNLDPLSYEQEYEAKFVSFAGRAYYAFDHVKNVKNLKYNPQNDLIFCFDFNVDPGVAAVCQEQRLPNGIDGTGVIGEVFIPTNSNTELVTKRLIEDWDDHEGKILVYGDASGGARGPAKLLGTEWEIVEELLNRHYGRERVFFRVDKSNPAVADRLKRVNSRCCSVTNERRLIVDPVCTEVIKDFEGVSLVEGGPREIDKKKDKERSHLSDAIGYYVAKEFDPSYKITVTQSH